MQVSDTIQWIDGQVGHISCLQQWIADTCEQLAGLFISRKDVLTVLLDQLPANSMAAFGVVKADWVQLGRHWRHKGYIEAVCKHKQVSTFWFLLAGVCVVFNDTAGVPLCCRQQ